MNCDDYLSMLATLPVDELAHGDARAHAAECRDCNRVTRVVAERERNMITAYDNLREWHPSAQVAAGVVAQSRRRGMPRFVGVGFALASVGALFSVLVLRLVVPAGHAPGTLIRESIPLRCISATQAADIASQNAPRSRRVWFQQGRAVLNIESAYADVEAVRAALAQQDDPKRSKCAISDAAGRSSQPLRVRPGQVAEGVATS